MATDAEILMASWNEVAREGDFVKLRRGPESGWWHDHNDGRDFGGNPCWWEGDKIQCGTCGEVKPSTVVASAGAQHE